MIGQQECPDSYYSANMRPYGINPKLLVLGIGLMGNMRNRLPYLILCYLGSDVQSPRDSSI